MTKDANYEYEKINEGLIIIGVGFALAITNAKEFPTAIVKNSESVCGTVCRARILSGKIEKGTKFIFPGIADDTILRIEDNDIEVLSAAAGKRVGICLQYSSAAQIKKLIDDRIIVKHL